MLIHERLPFKVVVACTSLSERMFPICAWSFCVDIHVQSVNERLFATQQVQKHVASLKSSEVYFSIDINYVFVVTKGSPWKMNSEMLLTARIQNICRAMAQWTARPGIFNPFPAKIFVPSVKIASQNSLSEKFCWPEVFVSKTLLQFGVYEERELKQEVIRHPADMPEPLWEGHHLTS